MTKRLSYLSILLFLVLSVNSISAQGLGIPLLGTEEVVTDSSNKILPIPINEVPARIEATEEEIKLGEKKILPKKKVLEIDSMLPVYIEFLQAQEKNAREFIDANPNRQKVDNLINKWSGYHQQLDTWQDIINDLEDKNLDILTPFKQKEKLWEITLENAKEEEAPPSVLNNIRRTLKDVTRIKEAIIKEAGFIAAFAK